LVPWQRHVARDIPQRQFEHVEVGAVPRQEQHHMMFAEVLRQSMHAGEMPVAAIVVDRHRAGDRALVLGNAGIGHGVDVLSNVHGRLLTT
jgi:hypothetical protein